MYKLCGTFLGIVTEVNTWELSYHNLSWSPQIFKLATKASQKLALLMRNIKGSPKDLKKTAYVTVVRASLDYASIWDPHLIKDKQVIGKIQHKAACWTTALVYLACLHL